MNIRFGRCPGIESRPRGRHRRSAWSSSPYLLHRIKDGWCNRCRRINDRGWLALDEMKGARHELREWLKTPVRANASVIFATQPPVHIGIPPTVLAIAKAAHLTAEQRAIEPQIDAIYRRFGSMIARFEILARATLCWNAIASRAAWQPARSILDCRGSVWAFAPPSANRSGPDHRNPR